MRPRLILALLLFVSPLASAQEFEIDTNALNQIVGAAEQWAQENLDENFLASLPQVDREKVEQFLREYQAGLRGDYVLDLAAFKNGASVVLPLLEAHEETEPYALWLRARLDYLEVADDFKRAAPPVPKIPDQPPKPLPNPTPAAERSMWDKKLRQTEWPKGATELVPKLKPVFTAEKVPAELIWVAEVESGFNARARSPVGAAGLFQLMPPTAKRFGLRSLPFDQRYQPQPSARAAAQYLRTLHQKFNDWPLALAAYNAGEGTVDRLLQRHKTRSFDGIATHLPAETQMFVPKVEATIMKREGVKLANLKVNSGSP